MAKFLMGVLVGFVVTLVATFIIIVAIGRIFAAKEPTIAANSVLMLTLDGDIPEAAPVDVSLPFLQTQNIPTIRDIWSSLRAAQADNRIRAAIIRPRGLVIGWARLQEIRADLAAFKKSGKPLYAFLEDPGSKDYYLASAADRIFLSPDDTLNVKGFLLEAAYFKGSLDKLGVDMQVDHIGRYKDAGDIFTRTNMSPETREVLNEVLDQIYGEFCSTIAQSRGKPVAEIKALIDQGPFTADQAKSNGLIDATGYEDQIFTDLKHKTGINDLQKTGIKTYFRAVPSRGDRIALLVGDGEIATGEGGRGLSDEEGIVSGPFSRTIRQVRNDGGIKGVILRVNSPGGDAVASDEILHELKLLSAAKPLVVSMSDVAASGGYFISITGDPIVSYANTITGSIGVLYTRPNVRGLYEKLGINEDRITRGRLADMDSETVPLSDAARQKLHEEIEATYAAFVRKVATARKKSYTQIDEIAQGRVWMGEKGRENGLVDELGGLDSAITLVRRKAGLSATGATNLVVYPPRRSLWDVLMNSSPESSIDAVVNRKIRAIIPKPPGTGLLHGGILQLLPYQLSVH